MTLILKLHFHQFITRKLKKENTMNKELIETIVTNLTKEGHKLYSKNFNCLTAEAELDFDAIIISVTSNNTNLEILCSKNFDYDSIFNRTDVAFLDSINASFWAIKKNCLSFSLVLNDENKLEETLKQILNKYNY